MLATKLFAPARRKQAVARRRLARRLDATLEPGHRLTLVSAPAGFGKTTVLSDWVAHLGGRDSHVRTAWLSLDDGDNDLTRLLTHLVASLESAGVDLEPAVVLDHLPGDASAALTVLLNAVARVVASAVDGSASTLPALSTATVANAYVPSPAPDGPDLG